MTFSFSNLTRLYTTWQHRHKSTMMCAILTRMLVWWCADPYDDPDSYSLWLWLWLWLWCQLHDTTRLTNTVQDMTRHDKKTIQCNTMQYNTKDLKTIQYKTLLLTFQSFSRQDKTTKQNKIRANYHAAETWQQAFVPERSKGAVSRTAIERCVGSNPTGCILLFPIHDPTLRGCALDPEEPADERCRLMTHKEKGM